MADSLASAPAVPVTPAAGPGAQKRKAEHTPETDTEQRSRRRARQSMSWSGCCSSACVQCLGLTGACAACSHC